MQAERNMNAEARSFFLRLRQAQMLSRRSKQVNRNLFFQHFRRLHSRNSTGSRRRFWHLR